MELRFPQMKYFYSLLLLALSSNLVSAAITITIAPDGSGGTTFIFSQTTDNPNFPISNASGGGFYLELPPSIFSPSLIGGGGQLSPIATARNLSPILATFIDAGSGFSYDVSFLVIGSDLSYGAFGFDRPFSAAQGQMEGRLDLVEGSAVSSETSPAELVLGTRTISSSLFGTVTVNVIPEPTSSLLVVLSSLLLSRRHRHPEATTRD
jgi:hypothetical protein